MRKSALLRDILVEEVQLLEKLTKSEEKTAQLLIAGDAQALHSLNLYREELTEKFKDIERRRRDLLPPGLTLKEFLSREKPPETGELQQLKRRLVQLHAFLKRWQKINGHLLKSNLQFVKHALSIFSPVQGESLYASSGEVEQKVFFSAGLIDSEA